MKVSIQKRRIRARHFRRLWAAKGSPMVCWEEAPGHPHSAVIMPTIEILGNETRLRFLVQEPSLGLEYVFYVKDKIDV